MLFTIYSSKLFEVIKCHLPEAHAYADDTQLYLSFSPDTATNQTDAVIAMERCISDIRTWMLTDKLKLNDDKTEFMLIGTKQQLSKVNIDCLTVGSIDVVPVTVARNLGTWFNSNLNLQEQIQKTCQSGFFPFTQYSAYPKISVPGVCTNFGPCFYHWSYRLLQQPSIWFTLCSST